ncbi:MAG: prohibitin family protein [Clostridia bacterium]|nr:prohibitin family protein [Clostridia bacterium]MDE6356724.1 prohibitin family protein [Clostridia bacterium]
MIYSALTAVLFLAVIAVGVVLIVRNIMIERSLFGRGKSKGKKVHMAIPCAVIAAGVLLLALIPGSFHTVDEGTVAVVKEMGVIKEVEEPGTYFDFWLTRKYEEYDAKVQQVEIKMDAYTADSQTMDISMTIQFQIRQDNVKDIVRIYGSLGALTNRIQSVAIERTKATLSQYQAEKLIEQRNTISPTVETAISEAIGDKYYVTFNSAVLTDITFSEAFEAAVEAKMMAQQEKLQAQYENEKKKEQAETALYVAEQEAKALVAKAQAQADAQVAAAKAEAESIMLKSVEIARMLGYEVETVTTPVEGEENEVVTTYNIKFTPDHDGKDIAEYMQYIEYMSKWDGKLPQVVGDGNGFMITIPGLGGDGNTGSGTNP